MSTTSINRITRHTLMTLAGLILAWSGRDLRSAEQATGTVVILGDFPIPYVAEQKRFKAVHAGFHWADIPGYALAVADDGSIVGLSGGPPQGWSNVVDIALGGYFALGLTKDGTVVARVPQFPRHVEQIAKTVSHWTNIVALSAGAEHCLGLRADGRVLAVGNNEYGQSIVPSTLSDVVAVASGSFHNVVLRRDGPLALWGDPREGQNLRPSGLSNVVKVAAGLHHNLALKRDGTVFAWGGNASGECEVPAGLSNVTAISAGQKHSLALRSDGTVVGWGNDSYGQATDVRGWSNITAIVAGAHFSLALQSDGRLVLCGSPGSFKIPGTLNGVVGLARHGSYAIKADGSVVSWGAVSRSELAAPPGLANVALIDSSAGWESGHALALLRDGSLVGWGDNSYGQLDVPEGLTNITAVRAGHRMSMVLKRDGTVVSWGQRAFTNEISNVSAIDAAAIAMALKSDGTVISTRPLEPFLTTPPGLSNVIALAAGVAHNVAVHESWGPFFWGDDTWLLNTPPEAATNLVAVVAGLDRTIGLTRERRAVTWGRGGILQFRHVLDISASLSDSSVLVADPPRLAVQRVGGSVRISWPEVYAGQGRLERSSLLGLGGEWTAVTGTVRHNAVTQGEAGFFRFVLE